MSRNNEFLKRISSSGAFAELINYLADCEKEEHDTLVDVAVAALSSGDNRTAQIQLGRWTAYRDLREQFERYRSDNDGRR